jgi:hypothetical protein
MRLHSPILHQSGPDYSVRTQAFIIFASYKWLLGADKAQYYILSNAGLSLLVLYPVRRKGIFKEVTSAVFHAF